MVNHCFDSTLAVFILRRLRFRGKSLVFWGILRVGLCFQTVCVPSVMASLTSSSRRSSSSYRSSSRYSSSSSYRSEGSLGGSSDSLDPLFEPFLDSADHSSLFGEESPGGASCLTPFSRHSRSSYGHTGKGLLSPIFISY